MWILGEEVVDLAICRVGSGDEDGYGSSIYMASPSGQWWTVESGIIAWSKVEF